MPEKQAQLRINYIKESVRSSKTCFQKATSHLGSVDTGPDPFGTGTKLVRISLVFTWDLVDPVRIGSAIAIWYQMGPLMKVILYGTVPFQFRTGPV